MILSSPDRFILPIATPNEVKNYWGASVSPALVPSFNEVLMLLFLSFLMCSEQASVFCRIVLCAHMLIHWCQRDCTWCEKFISLKIHWRLGFETWAIINLSFPTGDVNKLVRIIFRSNLQGSGWDNTIHFQKCQTDVFLNLKQVCTSMGLSKICFTF